MNCDETESKQSSNSKNSDKMDSPKLKLNKNRGKKRKRVSSESSSDDDPILPDNALATDRSVHVSAMKNNLDETSVRKILKKVVTNDHVLALVKLREEEEDSGPEDKSLIPKLTRAKVKELKNISPAAKSVADDIENLNKLELIPIDRIPVKTRPEVKALIAQELPEDEDDEEYKPANDEVPSDDEHALESSSDLDSQPRTPAAPAACTPSPRVVNDGPFKVPQDVSSARRKLELEEEATIALRTRSKLSLSATSIEHIESSFVPPDEPPSAPGDHLWSQFLSDILDPASTSRNEDDDETDPEYNVAADPDANDEDDEHRNPIKISRKELNDLVTELCNIFPPGADDLAENLANSLLTDTPQTPVNCWEGKQEPLSDEEYTKISERITFENHNNYTRFSIGKTEPETNKPREKERENVTPATNTSAKETNQRFIEVLPIKVEPSCRELHNATRNMSRPNTVHITISEQSVEDEPAGAPPPLARQLRENQTTELHIQLDGVVMTKEQILILEQQLRQHIQLATSNFLQVFAHPAHWTWAPGFKDYLVTLTKLGETNPSSVVNVCNLNPAMELVLEWERTVSVDNEENKEMIQFICNEMERSNRYYNFNRLYIGDFHPTLKKVVANSSVFLYPYLLPAMPYRQKIPKKFSYLLPEDELLVLALDQFRSLTAPSPRRRGRPGLRDTLALVVKHVLPFRTVKQLVTHIAVSKVSGVRDHPIRRYFSENVIKPVEHKILPYNPRLTLYEHPEHEMPKLWVRYLSKTSKRFKTYLHRRGRHHDVIPTGIPIQSVTPEATVKTPLPADFTKKIVAYRTQLKEKPEPATPETLQVIIQTPTENDTLSNDNKVLSAINLFKIVETSTGAVLMPLDDNTKTVNSVNTITTPSEVKSKSKPKNLPEVSTINDEEHCSCCILLRKICRMKQTHITDYFTNKFKEKRTKCYCNSVERPRMTNKLKLLISNFKSNSELAYNKLEKVLTEGIDSNCDMDTDKYTLDEIASTASYQIKMIKYISTSRRFHIKIRVKNLLSRFNIDCGDPLKLAKDLSKVYDVELLDLYTDFLEFLTPTQAEELDAYKDYFVRNCVQGLMERITEQVKSKEDRLKMMTKLKSVFIDSESSSCDICTYLLETMNGYHKLAEYTFSLFPHKYKTRCKESCNSAESNQQNPEEEVNESVVDHNNTTNYEADRSSNGEDEDQIVTENECDMDIEETKTGIIPLDISTTEQDSSLTIEFIEDFKKEPGEWKREEDKLILEVLKQQLSPEERHHKSILQMLDESDVYQTIEESLTQKSAAEIRERVLYLLSLLAPRDL